MARLYCGRVIRLLARPLAPPPPVSKLSLFLGLPVCRRSRLLMGEGGGVGGGARSQIILPQETGLVVDRTGGAVTGLVAQLTGLVAQSVM
jgi:hypothetical protein